MSLYILYAITRLLQRPFVTPRELAALLGMIQWLDLLRRPKLAILEEVYRFTKRAADSQVASVPPGALVELCVSLLLGIYWQIDLRTPFLPLLSATDASTSFGFGVSVAKVPIDLVEHLSKLSEKQGGFVVFGDSPEHVDFPTQLGERCDVDLEGICFSDVLSLRRRFDAHINVLEGEAFVLWLRWLLRSRRHHVHRVVALVDSTAWLGASCKGRSSSQLNRLLRRVAALCFVADVLLYIVFIPSLWNPSDGASRGTRGKCQTSSR
mmetsp:Transcript_152179/g.486273  ORF Transcript_152179/g.486273 Transcript_152179/m.486273 type:complete len:266 (+) Transcript_152179:1663-2460(+)